MRRFISIIITIVIFLSCSVPASAAQIEDIPYDSYIYWQEDTSKFLVGNKPMYEATMVITPSDYDIQDFDEPNDITFAPNGDLYVLDGNSSRIVIFDSNFNYKKTINNLSGETFNKASGIEVSNKGEIYIADTANKRVLIGNNEGILLKKVFCPENEIIPDDFVFEPIQITVDNNGYFYVLCKGSFYGALVFAPNGETEGFFGATRVNSTIGDIFDLLWNRWILTDKQRASQIQKIPFQFSDLCADENGLIYTTTGATTTYAGGQIRCLSPAGKNVMKNRVGRKSSTADGFNFGETELAELAMGYRIQDFVSLDVNNGIIYALDQAYGKVYVYNENCELYTIFGGGIGDGNQLGTFKTAVAIAVNENNVFVLDSKKGNITVFSINDYGKKLIDATSLTNNGEHSAAKPLWESILKSDRNNQLAYRGLAKAELSNENYEQALKYAKQGGDKGIYDQAFEFVRSDFIDKNINIIFVLLFVSVSSILAVGILNKRRQFIRIKAPKLKIALTCSLHPFDNFNKIKFAGQGSIIISTLFLFSYYIFSVLKENYSGYIHSDFNIEESNSFLLLLGTVGVVLLWVLCNWAMSVLFEGKSKLNNVFIVACYSLVPQIINNIFYLIASNLLLEKEAIILTTVSTVSLILTGVILCIGTMIIHEFDFFKFLFTTIITVIAMAVVIFVLFMIVILVQQFYAFIRTIFIEILYR